MAVRVVVHRGGPDAVPGPTTPLDGIALLRVPDTESLAEGTIELWFSTQLRAAGVPLSFLAPQEGVKGPVVRPARGPRASPPTTGLVLVPSAHVLHRPTPSPWLSTLLRVAGVPLSFLAPQEGVKGPVVRPFPCPPRQGATRSTANNGGTPAP